MCFWGFALDNVWEIKCEKKWQTDFILNFGIYLILFCFVFKKDSLRINILWFIFIVKIK